MSPILSLILAKLQEQTIISPFVIIHGSGVGAQWSDIRTSCQEAAGFFAYQDVLELKDYTSVLGKSHSLRVEFKKTSDTDLLYKEAGYTDKGVREINDRLSMSPAGELKILLIEHIDRATIGAANALLKSLEEPFPNCIIIASTMNKDVLLPTILSRALLIHCDSIYAPMILDEGGKKLLFDMVDALARKDIAVLSKGALQIAKGNHTQAFLDNLIYYYDSIHSFVSIPPIVHSLRMISSNVNPEHTIFALFLELIE